MNRRQFISQSSAAALFASLDAFAHPIAHPLSKSNLKILATNWGFQGSMDELCAKVKKEGYDGLELWWPTDAKSRDEMFASLKKHNLEIGFLVGDGSSDYAKHLDNFTKNLVAAATNTVQKPLYINCHSGKDYFSFDQNLAFIEATTKMAKQTGITICHETHRSRIMYSAPLTRQFMEKRSDLRLTADLSHWCCVHESLLEDQMETINMALARTEHIHARVGHAEGPQVSDPRAPEWEKAVKTHFGWWDKVVERKKQAGETITILTEFGPPDYLWTLPYTRQPIANQWDINVHMLNVLRKRYGA
jgi:sugar phosphate isomerase/epimerase